MTGEITHEFEGEEFGEEEEMEEVEEVLPVENGTETTTSVSSSNKRIKEMAIDRLSALPDSLLMHILSFLSMKEAAIIAVLSKRWQFLWADFPKLKFYQRSRERDAEKIRELVTRVHRILVIRSVKFVQTFSVRFRYYHSFASDINMWIEYAVKNKVREVYLQLESDQEDFYLLPQMIYSHSSLTILMLQGCIIAPRRTIEWKSLKTLHIKEVNLPQYALEEIVSGCPVLESLGLNQCWGFNRVEVNSRSLCSLSVYDWEDGNDDPLLEISAPYVHRLYVWLYPKGRKLVLRNIPSVIGSRIFFCGVGYDTGSEDVMSTAKEIFQNILHVEELELGGGWFEALAKLVMNGWRIPQSRLRDLTVSVSNDEESFSGIVSLLESFTNLEKLSISSTSSEALAKLVMNGWRIPQSRLRDLTVDVSNDEESFSGIVSLLESFPNLEKLTIMGTSSERLVNWSPAAANDLNCDLLHLKTVHMLEFANQNGEPMLRLGRILLKRAKVLKEMVIDIPSYNIYSSSSTDFIETLRSYPKSSRNTVIVLY